MTWVRTECHFFYLPGTEPQIVRSLADLPAPVVTEADKYLSKRLGRPFLSKLQFHEAHVHDLDAYYKKNGAPGRAADHLPKYELAFRVTFYTQGPVEYCATLHLDASGAIMEDIALPDIGANPERGEVVPLLDILNLAHSLGIPTDKAYLDMRYDTRSGCLEYLVSYNPADPPPEYNRITLYIKAHDPKDYFWFKSKVMSDSFPDGRPNNGSQPTDGAPSIQASCPIRALRTAGG
jgi:hypothetical protein